MFLWPQLLRAYKKLLLRWKFRRVVHTNTISLYNSLRVLQQFFRVVLARWRVKMRAAVFIAAANILRRAWLRHRDYEAFWLDRTRAALAAVEADGRFGFRREKKIHHRPSNTEAAELRLVSGVPVRRERGSPRFTHDGTEVYEDHAFPTGASLVGDMDILRVFKAEEGDLFNPPSPGDPQHSPPQAEKERRAKLKRPLGRPVVPVSYYF